MSSPQVHTPRPAPVFMQAPLTFSTKKSRGHTPVNAVPPKPPIKSAPPVSRIFPKKELLKALPVSFKSPEKALLSPHYNESNKELFFDQCFNIVSRLGVGSFGEVFKVKSKEDGWFYAVKRSRQRFRGESDRHRKLEEVAKHESLPEHANCVKFLKAWEEKQHLYIQTELCKTSLSVYAEENHNIPEKVLWNYLVDLLMAVRHLHDHDLVHMDIKPENIFISDNNVCKLGDFGLVIDLKKDIEMSDAQEGDPKYLAPELMKGKFGKSADIFSLGITILELAGDLDMPRGGDLWHQLRSGILPEDFLAGRSQELKDVIRLMMEPDHNCRPTVQQILEHPSIQKVLRERLSEFSLHEDESSCVHMHSTPPRSVPLHKHPPEWDHSFSDDDVLDHVGDHGSNNSMGILLLDTSSGSDDSFRLRSASASGYVLPSLMRRQPPPPSPCKAIQQSVSESGLFDLAANFYRAGRELAWDLSENSPRIVESWCQYVNCWELLESVNGVYYGRNAETLKLSLELAHSSPVNCSLSNGLFASHGSRNQQRDRSIASPSKASPGAACFMDLIDEESKSSTVILDDVVSPELLGHTVEPRNLMKVFEHTLSDEDRD